MDNAGSMDNSGMDNAGMNNDGIDNSESIDRVSATRPRTPWEIETQRRWARISALIAETEHDLSQTTGSDNRRENENALRTLKRAALSVWVDARRIGLPLPGAPSDQSRALVEG